MWLLFPKCLFHSIAVGELYFGAYKSLKVQENLTRIDKFVLNNTVLFCDSGTAKKYGGIKNRLKEKAKPIPETELKYHFVLVNYDIDFKNEDEAVTHAKYDLDQAANQKQLTGSDSAFAESLKSRGYRSVDGFKIVK